MRCSTLLTGLLSTLLVSTPASWGASQPAIEIVLGDGTTVLTQSELLQRADLTEIRIPRDPTYKQPMSYRALPLARLLRDLRLGPDEVIEIVATDGFVTPLPPDLAFAQDDTGSVPYLAIEPMDESWPVIPGKTVSRRPLLRRLAQTGGVRRAERAVALRGCQLPQRRDAGAPLASFGRRPDAPRRLSDRAGQALFITQCMVCHTLNGAGTAQVGSPKSDRVFDVDGVAPADP